ncbi:uncharacterized protein LOC129909003 [Episyrphus balteatus]|uniref:uncharacterized protein LOC129909003 n=1 Tax=Episyrphus balteatus TaxID=286459 RepID=UPI00248693B4|nr:uncharacterized protein LOC129909003 [Episyrphus balteatus]
MNKLEFAFMLVIWNDILQSFKKVNKVLQNEDLTLLTCANLYRSLCDQLEKMRDNFDTIEMRSKELLPDGSYMITRKRIRKKMANDGNTPDVDLSSNDKFRINAFYVIIYKLRIQMDSRGQIYKEISTRFDFLCTSNEKVNVLACAQRLVSNYPEDLNSELSDELIQFHRYVMHKNGNSFKFFNQANLYKIMWEDKITSAFPNVGTALR